MYVHGLRQALGGGRIETRGTGYRLTLGPDELDFDRFTQLVRQGRSALEAAEPAEAAARLDEALALWRGSALGDLGGEPVAAAEAGRLEEARLQAQELLNDAQLALGRHETLIPALERQIASEPYRERLRGQHVLALYRSGRQKEALETHRLARADLVEELGVDPGPELQELERAILRHDPALSAPEPPAPPPLRLPTPPTSLVGRRLEGAAVGALLQNEGVRLLTLTGPGGTGKTRLALAVASELGPQLRDGATFVDLAPVRDGSLLAPTIAHALDVAEGASVEEALLEHLRERRLLLVLDNLEQLVPHVDFIGRLLAVAPRLLVLATSRTPLRLAAEHEYPVPPLSLPHARARFEDVAANDAVRLFVARARAVDPAFELTDTAAPAVAHICERLDGLPLAIELAAARIRMFSPAALSSRLDRRLEVLTGGPRDVPERQQTLRATLEWSYELLDDAERRVFTRLGVFPASWTLDAAGHVCDADDIVEIVARLVDDNLVRRLEREGEARFAMLETVAEYARTRLADGGAPHAVAQRHADYMLKFVVALGPQLVAADKETFERFADEYDNFRAAVDWFGAAGDVVAEVELLEAAQNFLNVRGRLSETRAWLEAAVARSADAPPRTRGLARIHCAAFAYRQGDYARSRELTHEALELFRDVGDASEIGRCIGTLGNVAVAEGDLDGAIALYEEAAQLARELGNQSRLAVLLANLGAIAGQQGDQQASVTYAAEAATLQRERGELDTLSISLHNLGRAQLALGQLDAARTALGESLAAAREVGYPEVIAYNLSGLAELALAEQRAEQAAELLGASEDLFRELGVIVDQSEAEAQARMLSSLYDSLGTARTDELRARGAARAVEELVAA